MSVSTFQEKLAGKLMSIDFDAENKMKKKLETVEVSNKNKSATISKSKKFSHLNKGLLKQ
jgi:RNA recognition motif-containing protein